MITPPAPSANYVSTKRVGQLLYVSGQVSIEGERLIFGRLGSDLSVAQGAEAARICALNIIGCVQLFTNGNLGQVRNCVRLTGYVNCTRDFVDMPTVLDGASNLMVETFGERGRHSRVAVGVSSLPRGAAVEVDAIFELC